MLILAFDTSSRTAAVAILRNKNILYDVVLDTGQNHSEVLLPAIEQACATAGIAIADIDGFACTLGPGSFTGLRIGAGTLKGLMMAHGKPAVGVSSLEALALNVDKTGKTVCPVMDAGRGQVYTACYRFDKKGMLIRLEEEKALSPDQIGHQNGEGVIFVGEGAVKYAEEIRKASNAKSEFADAGQQYIRASCVGLLGLKKFRNGDLLDLNRFTPTYLRSADALLKKKVLP